MLFSLENIIIFVLLVVVIYLYARRRESFSTLAFPKPVDMCKEDNVKVSKNGLNTDFNCSSIDDGNIIVKDTISDINIKNSIRFDKTQTVDYPASNPVSVQYDNFTGNISNFVLNKLAKVLKQTKNQLNEDAEETIFNFQNYPMKMLPIDENEISGLSDLIINKINSNLEDEKLTVIKIKNILALGANNQIKKEFSVIADYKLNFEEESYQKPILPSNSLIIKICIISTKNTDSQMLCIKKLEISDFVTKNPKGSNSYDNTNHLYRAPYKTKYADETTDYLIAQEREIDEYILAELGLTSTDDVFNNV